MEEVWKEICPNYFVSSLGNVESFKYGKRRRLKPWLDLRGYLKVRFYFDKKKKNFSVHRLVATAFIPNLENKPEVNHINGIKVDNRVENLEWATCLENVHHAFSTGLRKTGEDSPQAKLTDTQIIYIRNNPDALSIIELAKKFKVRTWTISQIQLGKSRKLVGGQIREPAKRLTEKQREEICQLYNKGINGFGLTSLGKKYGVSAQAIWYIVNKK